MSFLSDAKKILRIAIPLLASRLMNVVVFFGGFVMIAKLGTTQFAASSLASSIFITLMMIGVGILYAIGIKISRSFGAGEISAIREYFYAGAFLAIGLALASIVVMLGISFALPYLGQKPELIPVAQRFLYALCPVMIPAMLISVGNQLVTALLRPRIITFSSLLNVPISLAAFYLFIFGGLGIPPLGIWGFAIALFIGDFILIAVVLIYAFTHPYFEQFKLLAFRSCGIRTIWQRTREIIQLGLPMGIQFGAEIAAYSVCTFLVGLYGIAALNSWQISTQILVIGLMIPFTVSEAAAILVGNAVGRQHKQDMRRIAFSSIWVGLIMTAFASLLYVLFPKLLISIYINVRNPILQPIVSLSILFLYASAITQLFDSMRHIITGGLRGMHDSQYPMYVGIGISWLVMIPAGFLLSETFKFGPIAYSLSGGVAFLVAILILLPRLNQKTKEGRDQLNAK